MNPLGEQRGEYDESLAQAAGEAVDRLAELAREHIQLARIEVGGELEITIKRSLWYVAGLAALGVGAILAVIALFVLAGALIPSPGVRLLILAILASLGGIALVFQAKSISRAPATDATSARTMLPPAPARRH